MILVYVIVHYDEIMIECPIEVFLIKWIIYKGWKKSSSKDSRELEERVTTMHFHYLNELKGGGGVVNHYTVIEMIEDDDIEAFFDIYDSIGLQTELDLYVTFQTFASSSTQPNLQTTSHHHHFITNTYNSFNPHMTTNHNSCPTNH